MRNTIRDDRLEEARRSVPALVSLSLPEDQAAIVAELVAAFVVPNSLYNEALTEAARESARQAVTPVSRSYQAGETIVQRGQIITETSPGSPAEAGLDPAAGPLEASGQALRRWSSWKWRSWCSTCAATPSC